MFKKLLMTSAMLVMPLVASASSLSIVGGSTVNFSGYNGTPASITGVYTQGQTGALSANVAGTLYATYLGSESGYDDSFWLQLGRRVGDQFKLTEDERLGETISLAVNAGELDFWFKDSSGGFVGNDGINTLKNSSFAILAGKCLTTYGCFDFILGFNDAGGGQDHDYDDLVVGLKLTPNVVPPTAVPLPGALVLFGSALFGAGALRRRKQAAANMAVA